METKPPTPKKSKESVENVTETKVAIDIKTVIEVIASEVKAKREAISNANKELQELQMMITEIFQNETEIQKE